MLCKFQSSFCLNCAKETFREFSKFYKEDEFVGMRWPLKSSCKPVLNISSSLRNPSILSGSIREEYSMVV